MTGATQYLLLNTSDIRPVSMTTRATMELAWRGVPTSQHDADLGFYKRWAEEEFGESASEQVSRLYRSYFAAPLRLGVDQHEAGDQFYHTEIRLLLSERMSETPLTYIPDQAPKWQTPHLLPYLTGNTFRTRVDDDVRRCSQAQTRWDALWREAKAVQAKVTPERRPYYQASVLTMVEINRDSNLALLDTALSLQRDIAGDKADAKAFATKASEALASVRSSMHQAEYGHWRNWYRGDWLTGVSRTQEIVATFFARLSNPFYPMTPPVDWNDWEAYHYILRYQGNRVVDTH